ncbi:orange carotenoid protein N-terminal domain-containing protein [Limnoraphis robusta]|uniref:Orange carotenoid protein n=1 Tax=Limnoraphis robusta CS-951 TaxID=1637645 RepID=A0A0F5Y7H3_9CYAN|nr:orange carotenoid protein N-terminal domain-containing protein [Limnoraphis robusta]KKD34824.1 Orange carotenoid protein [Limnoraphis robusta CS-951]KMW70643.1 Orange carotenoid protein [Limnoraphis robusta CS-951]
MTFTTESSTTSFSQVFVSSDQNAVARVTASFKALNVDQQLGVLWFLYTKMGRTVTPAAPGAARLQFAEGLLNDIKQMPPQDQLKAMRDIAASVNTPVSRAYGVLGANTKLAFWYQLAEWMKEGSVIGVPAGYPVSRASSQVLAAIEQLEFSQQITVLRNVVSGMGIDPLA